MSAEGDTNVKQVKPASTVDSKGHVGSPSPMVEPGEGTKVIWDGDNKVNQKNATNAVDSITNVSSPSVVNESGRGARERKMTDRGFEYNLDLYSREFRSAISTWHKHASALELAFSEEVDSVSMTSMGAQVDKSFQKLVDCYSKVESLGESSSVHTRFGQIETQYYELKGRFRAFLKQLETDKRSLISKSTRVSSKSGSVKSGSVRDAAMADVAGLKAHMKFIEAEARQRAELEKLQTWRKLSVAEAKVQALSSAFDLPEADDMNNYVQSYIDNLGRSEAGFGVSGLINGTSAPNTQSVGSTYVVASGMDTGSRSGHAPQLATSEHLPFVLPSSAGLPTLTPPVVCLPSSVFPRGQHSPSMPATIKVEATHNIWSANSPIMSQMPAYDLSGGGVIRSGADTKVTNGMPISSIGQVPSNLTAGWCPSLINFDDQLQPIGTGSFARISGESSVGDLTKSIMSQIALVRIPPPEPGMFKGNSLEYPCWRASFDALISHAAIPDSEKLYFLRRYLGGDAKEAVEGFFLFGATGDSYEKARKLLDERYGNSFAVAEAFRKRLNDWPKITGRDCTGLRKFTDFLRACDAAMSSVHCLRILNDEHENRRLLSKLPDWLTTRWARKAHIWRQTNGEFPPFHIFLCFMQDESEIACDPVTSLRAVAGDSSGIMPKVKSNTWQGRRTIDAGSMSTNSKEKDKGASVVTLGSACPNCEGDHSLNICRNFLAESVQDRKAFIQQHRLCYGCLKAGHQSKACGSRLTCDICGKRHPTSLHGDVKPQTPGSGSDINRSSNNSIASSAINASVTQANQMASVCHLGSAGTCQASMIVPVWISHPHSGSERLVYALLDTQSDTTFVLESTRRALGVDGTEVKLLLSTMLAESQPVDSIKVEGLVVRGFNSDIEIELPATYSRHIIPIQRSRIPTPDTVSQWPYLERLRDHLVPLQDCEVGLLIGYNCPKALVPCDVIPPSGNGPFAQQSVLGWGIVGLVGHGQANDDEFDQIGVSHRQITCEVPQSLALGKGTKREGVVLACPTTRVKEQIAPYHLISLFEAEFKDSDHSSGLSRDDHRFLRLLKEGIHVGENGHYTMPLPFRHGPPALPKSKDMALQRLNAKFEKDPEVKQISVSLNTVTETPRFASLLDRIQRFSDWYRAKRALVLCTRYINRLRYAVSARFGCPANTSNCLEPVTVAEFQATELVVIKSVQQEVYTAEIKALKAGSRAVSLDSLDPFLDSNGILRVGGRLRKGDLPFDLTHPVILPKKNHVTDLIVRAAHKQVGHQGRGITMNQIRSNGFWIVGCGSLVSWTLRNCVVCRRFRGEMCEQKMADLPEDRINPSPPFTEVGVDFFGPFIIKEGRKELKRYGCIFICMSSRAVHIEASVALSTDAFINVLRRFLAVRGPIKLLRSDQGTNFIGADNELRDALSNMNMGAVNGFLLQHGCDAFKFRFNVPSASHAGGVWERAIRTTRNVLSVLLYESSAQLNDDSLRTLFYEVMCIVNSRPLSVECLSDSSILPLSPNNLLTMKSNVLLAPPGNFQREDLYIRKRWRRVQYLANEFWKRWKHEYLQGLQVIQKWVKPRRNLCVGDIVLVKDDNLPRSCWPLARVIQTYTSADGKVRSVKVCLADQRTLDRPIQKLVLLLELDQVDTPSGSLE